MKKLEIQDVQYYYDNMDTMISTIKTPLDKFTSFSKTNCRYDKTNWWNWRNSW